MLSVVHTFNPSTHSLGRDRQIPKFRLAWSADGVPGQPGLYRETLPQNREESKHKQNKAV